MDAIDLLRQQALARRNAAILAAKRDYHVALKEIDTLNRKLGIKRAGRPRKQLPAGDPLLKATTVALEVLREGKALNIVELTLEVQRRGCRPLDDPRKVMHAIRSGITHYRQIVRKDAEGRWALRVPALPRA